MRPIKFRGIDLETGDFVFGYFVHYVPQSSFCGIVDQDGFLHEIKPDTVAQFLLRHTSSNEEFYEGDQVGFNRQGRPLFIQSALILVDNNGAIYQWDERFFDHSNDFFQPYTNEEDES